MPRSPAAKRPARAVRLAAAVPRRPAPPAAALAIAPDRFVPAPELLAWIRETFLDEGAPLENPAHRHLRWAAIGVLWTNVPNRRQMRTILATAEMPFPRGSAWQRARAEVQLTDWFGAVPDFVLTFQAREAAALDDPSFCALVEHELYHCAQARDQWGAPRFHRETGRPVFALRGHDVEEFTGVVARYGARAAGVEELVQAALNVPAVAPAAIAAACGTCLAKVA